MDLTPDACMENVWADEKSLGKRDRDKSEAIQNNCQPPSPGLLCVSNLGKQNESPAKPRDLNQFFLTGGQSAKAL